MVNAARRYSPPWSVEPPGPGGATRQRLPVLGRSVFGLLVRAARDGDRGLGLGPGAAHVEAAMADRDIVAAEQPHPLHAAVDAAQHIVLGQREDHRARA